MKTIEQVTSTVTYKQFFAEWSPEERQRWQLVEDDPDMMRMKIRHLAPGELGKSPWHEGAEVAPIHGHLPGMTS